MKIFTVSGILSLATALLLAFGIASEPASAASTSSGSVVTVNVVTRNVTGYTGQLALVVDGTPLQTMAVSNTNGSVQTYTLSVQAPTSRPTWIGVSFTGSNNLDQYMNINSILDHVVINGGAPLNFFSSSVEDVACTQCSSLGGIWKGSQPPLDQWYVSQTLLNGACGTDNGQSFIKSPTAAAGSICASGGKSLLKTTATGWSWTCNGEAGGTPATCSANLVSASGTQIPPASVIIDSSGEKWTVVGGVIYVNGSVAGYSNEVTDLAYVNGVIYQENINKDWWSWNGTGWATASNPLLAPINGAAGADKGEDFATLSSTSAGLCSAGTVASFTTLANGWTWSCNGSNGGSNDTSGVAYLIVNGAVGADKGKDFTTLSSTSAGLCSAGTVASFTTTSTGWTWGCNGSGSGTNDASGIAYLIVNGAVGTDKGKDFASLTSTSAGLCSAGTVASFTTTSTGWTWSCNGSNTGTNDASGIAYLTVNGACGSANLTTLTSAPATGLCNAGTATAVTGTGPWTWSCNGINNGTNATCSASLQALSVTINSVTATPQTSTTGQTVALSTTVQTNENATNYSIGFWIIYNDGSVGGTIVQTQYFQNLNFTPGVPITETYNWAIPATAKAGTYRILSGVWNNSAVSVAQQTTSLTVSAASVNGAVGTDKGGDFATLTATSAGLCSAGTVASFTTLATGWTWSCDGSGSGTNDTSGIAYLIVNGAVGADKGQDFASLTATSAGLCSAGTVASVTTTSSGWTWSCNGSNTGTNDASGIAYLTVNGACGSANGSTVSAAPATGLCNAGTATAVTGTGPWSWTCDGINNGTNSPQCVANLAHTAVNGECGLASLTPVKTAPSSNLCASGTASAVTGAGPWSWDCQSSNGGQNSPTCTVGVSAYSINGSKTINAAGQVGLTNYQTLTFGSQLYATSWGSTNAQPNDVGYAPANLFWKAGTFYTDTTHGWMASAQYAASSLASQGIVPTSTAQRWEDTFEASEPAANFTNEPSFITSDRNSLNLPNLPEYQAWVTWTNNRSQLLALANDGGSMGTDFRPWGGNWGYISPMTPLDAADCPLDLTTGQTMTSCNWGDWYADKYAGSMGLSGAFGFVGSDFSNGQPDQQSMVFDFNPLVTAQFQKYLASIGSKAVLPTSSVSATSSYINQNLFSQWNDFICISWGNFYKALVDRIGDATGNQALIVAGGNFTPGWIRTYGTDTRLYENIPGLAPHMLVVWDNITIEPDRDGASIVWGIVGPVLDAARAPDIRTGAYLSAEDTTSFWPAVNQFHPKLSAAAQQEWGVKQLKRQWLEFGWAHIATRQGTVRRALAFAWKDHWDGGTIDPTLQNLIQTIYPTRPFGFGFYYPVSVEKAMEPNMVNSFPGSYLGDGNDFLNFRQTIPLNYYVSDEALSSLQPSAYPAAWVLLDTGNYLPASELAQLQAIAPVVTSIAQAQALPNAPLSYPTGLTGTGFYDQNNRLIITVTNVSTDDNATAISGNVTLKTLANGAYVATDLFTNTITNFSVTNGVGQLPVNMARWDTTAIAIQPASN